MTKATKPARATPLMRALVELRLIHRMSQRHFAEFIGVPRGRIATIETGYSVPTDAYLIPFAKLGGVTVEEIRAGKIAINRCGSCNGSGIVSAKTRLRKKMVRTGHPRTPTVRSG